MLKRSFFLVFLFLAFDYWASAQQSSNLVGTWVGKVQGYGVDMKLTLDADGSADYEGVMGKWRVQSSKLLLTQEGETVGYNFTLQGSQLTLSGGDLMAPMVLTRSGGGRMGRAPAPSAGAPPPEEGEEEAVNPLRQPPARVPPASAAPRPAAGKRALSEADVISLLEGSVPSRRIIELVEERGMAFPLTPASVSRLKAKGATNALIGALQQAEDRGGGEAAAMVPQPSSAERRAGGGGLATALEANPSRGPRHRNEKMGLSFVPPPGWKVGERQGLLLMGSDTEAGLVIIRLARRTGLQQLVQEYGEGMQEEGLQLMPTVQAQEFPAGRNRAVAGELAGVAQDGARIRARAVAVESPFGDAVVVLGLTTEEKYSGLKPRVESIASSFEFSQPQAPPVLEAIAGQYFYMSASSFGSSERYINLCSDGRFSENSNIYSSGSAGTAYGEGGGGTAQWTADGDASQGTVTVSHPNGETNQFQYRRSGGDLIVSGRTYARYGDGSCTKRSPVYD